MTARGNDRRQLVTFEAAGERFAADIFAVERVLRYHAPRHLPNAAPWLRGVIAHAGAAVPVIDLRERLGLASSPPTERSRILIIAVDGERVGVVVDAVLTVLAVDASEIELPPAIYRGLSREFLEGIVRQGDELHVVLAVARLLTNTERIEMERVMTTERRDG